MNIFFCFKSDFSHLSLLKYLPASIKSFTSIHFTFYISYWQDFTHIHIICSIYIFEPSLPRQHHGNHTVGYCASYFVFFMNKYVNIYFFYCKHRLQRLPGALPRERKRNENQFLI